MIEITLKRTLDDEFVSSVLITAFDGDMGACWYWCEPDGDKWLKTMKFTGDDAVWTTVKVVRESVTTEESEAGKTAIRETVDDKMVTLGIQRILDGGLCAPYIREYVVNGVLESDAGHIDAEAADAIVQAGMFGELVYG